MTTELPDLIPPVALSTDPQSTDHSDCEPARTHTIVQFTDTHLDGIGKVHGADTAHNLRHAINMAVATVPAIDALVFTGDLADGGQTDAYRTIRNIVDPVVAELGVPAIYGIGNHDERAAFRSVLLDNQPCPETGIPAPYVEDQPDAPIDYTIDVAGLRLVMLDSTVPGHHYGYVEERQLDWLHSELINPLHSRTPTLLTMHHPPFAWDSAAPDAWMMNEANFRNQPEVERVLAKVGRDAVVLVLTGHHHEPMAGRIGSAPLWAGASTAMSHQVDGEHLRFVASSGFSVIDVFNDRTAVVRSVTASPREVLAEVTLGALKAQYFEGANQ